MKQVYVVCLPLAGSDQVYELCQCEDEVKVGALITALLAVRKNAPTSITVVAREVMA